MPRYDFLNEKTGEIKELVFSMNEEKKYIDENGVKWTRQFSVPQAAPDGLSYDVHSSKDFARKTSKGGTLGSIWDMAAEWSAERASKNGGVDEIGSRAATAKQDEINKSRAKNNKILAENAKKAREKK